MEPHFQSLRVPTECFPVLVSVRFLSPGASLSAGASLSTWDQWKPRRFWCRENFSFSGWWGV